MQPPIGFVRVVLGILCIFCAHFLGRAVARAHSGQVSHLYRWALRTAVAGMGVVLSGGLDTLTIVTAVLAGLSGASGYCYQQRPKKPQEDLSKVIFPKD